MATNDDMQFDEADLISLGEKLASLDLTEPERAALAAVISDDDVVGFGRFDIIGGIRKGVRNVRGPAGEPGVFGARVPGVRAKPIIGDQLPKPGRF